ncbi:transcription initiation factor TFIID subunit 3-like [Anopheles moucheti]|uniref:transcription initiation factor TFIID subunit 3-like n=1 Tax=Anopheles moucheti TaxID=186751 RepID=UPI0022F03336|nr:transcription initiation factor TFIID subunit 3-like [Anopheles moucheti]
MAHASSSVLQFRVAMSNKYASHMLDVSVAQICTTIGWTTAHKSSLQFLSYSAERYMHKIAELVKQFAELNNRTTPNMDDLAFVFNYLSIEVDEMVEYCKNVHAQLPYDVSCVSIPNGGEISNIQE